MFAVDERPCVCAFAEAGFEDDGGSAGADAEEVQVPSADVDHAAGHGCGGLTFGWR